MRITTLLFSMASTLTVFGSVQAAEIELWRLDCGIIQVNDLSRFSDTFGYTGEEKTLTDSCYLIRHDQNYMLWDTGLPRTLLGAKLTDAAFSLTLKQTITQQLDKIGIKPDQINLIGISHYHFDHVGQAADFAKAKLVIGAADFAAIQSKPLPFGANPDLLAPWISGKAAVEKVSSDKDIFGDGSVTMLSMPGHTPGSYALLLRLAKMGPVVLSGDVVHFEQQLKNNYVPPFNTSRARSLASMDRLRGVVKNLGAVLVVQHDADDIAKLPIFPKSAD